MTSVFKQKNRHHSSVDNLQMKKKIIHTPFNFLFKLPFLSLLNQIIPFLFSTVKLTLLYLQVPPGPPGPESTGDCSC